MMNMKMKRFRTSRFFLLFFLIVIFVVGIIFIRNFVSSQNVIENSNGIKNIVNKLEYQKSIDEKLRAELESESYTFENPLIVLDPYNESPLTALILFCTEQPSKIAIEVSGCDEDTEAIYEFSEVSKYHIIPVYGLYPDTNNKVKIKLLEESDDVISENIIDIQTEKLPNWLEELTIESHFYQGDYEEGINYKIYLGKYAFDKNGTIRWFLSDNKLLQSTCLKYLNNRFIVAKGSYLEGDTFFYEIDRLGKIYNVYYSPYGVHHDISPMPNGNLLITGSFGETVQDFVYELDVSSGKIVNTIDFKNILQRNRYRENDNDWMHANSVVYDESDGTIIVSSNYQSTVAKVTWPEGEIKWLLSSPYEYESKFYKYLLRPVGENFEYSYNQHDATILLDYDSNPDTIDIMLFDNGKYRFLYDEELNHKIKKNKGVKFENYSRMVHYRINEKNMTVEQIWQYGKEQGNELYSVAMGSARILENGNCLGLFASPPTISFVNIVEVDSNSNVVWNSKIVAERKSDMRYGGYKTFRLPFYFEDDKECDIYKESRNMIGINLPINRHRFD